VTLIVDRAIMKKIVKITLEFITCCDCRVVVDFSTISTCGDYHFKKNYQLKKELVVDVRYLISP